MSELTTAEALASETDSHPEQPRSRSIPREYYEALLIAVIFVNFARIFVFQAFKIPTGSMIDNLLIGDHIIVNKFAYGPASWESSLFPHRPIRRGDIVVFRFPGNPRVDYVKRVIALPGEIVHIRDKRVYVNDALLPEPYVVHEDPRTYRRSMALPEQYRARDQFGPFEVPLGEYFVLGDNRDRSDDSRFWGTVKRELIKGRAFMIYWSYRGNRPAVASSSGERLRELIDVATGFVPNTRWDRTFRIIDAEYHYDDSHQ